METVSFLKAMSASFNEMRAANELVDMVLVFGELRLACHKVVLASSSDYFRRMFSCGLRESQSDEVGMKEIDAETGRLLVQYLYTGKIDITEENAHHLISASNMLLLSDLKAASEKFLCKHIQPSNCVSILNLSHFYELGELMKVSRQFIKNKWAEISNESMVELKERDFTKILKAHSSHEDKFIRLQRWIKSDAERDERFMDLMQHVDLSHCSHCFIRGTVTDEGLLRNPQGIKLIQKALNGQAKSQTATVSTSGSETEGAIQRDRITLMLRHTENFSTLCSRYHRPFSRSSHVHVRNWLWHMEVSVRRCGDRDWLGVDIVSQPDSIASAGWSCMCKVNYEVRVLKQIPIGKPFTKKSKHVFGPSERSLSWNEFMPWNKLADPKNGYIKDGRITLEVSIVEDVYL